MHYLLIIMDTLYGYIFTVSYLFKLDYKACKENSCVSLFHTLWKINLNVDFAPSKLLDDKNFEIMNMTLNHLQLKHNKKYQKV